MTNHAIVPLHLDTLAGIINTAQTNIEYHAKSMLYEAKAAGDALIEAKAVIHHGGFQSWVEANCHVSYSMAKNYMRVSKHFQKGTALSFSPLDLAQMSIRSFLDIKDKPKATTGGVSAPLPKTTDKETKRVLKIASLATRGEGGEKQAAENALEKYTDADLRNLIILSFNEGLKQQSRDKLLIILTDMAEEMS